MATAEKLRSDYDFAHTSDAKLLPRGESVTGPVVRLFKPFDELFVDSKVQEKKAFHFVYDIDRWSCLFDFFFCCNPGF